MKQPSLKLTALIALALLQCTVHAQVSGAQAPSSDIVAAQIETQTIPLATSDPIVPTTRSPVATTTKAVPTTTVPPVPTPTTTTTTNNAPAPITTTTEAPPTNTDPVVAPTTTSRRNSGATSDSSEASPTRSPTENTTTNGPHASTRTNNPSSGNPSSSESPATPSNENNDTAGQEQGQGQGQGQGNSNKTAVIAGSVVGGVVGIALIAGLLTCLNRRGGCTSRTRRRSVQQDFEAHDNEYGIKMTDNHATGAAAAAVAAGGAVGAIHVTESQAPSSPFQHARRFVPPTSNPTGYMNLTDEEYGYQQHNTNAAPYQNYNNTAGASDYDYQQHAHQGNYGQHDYHNEYPVQQDYAHNDYRQHDGDMSVSGVGYQQGYYNQPGSNVTTPTLVNAAPIMDNYHAPMKPDQIEQKPNAI